MSEVHSSSQDSDVNNFQSCDEAGWVPLHWAVVSGSQRKVQAALDINADINAATETGATPLHLAALYDKVEIVKMLVEKGANCHIRDKMGLSALDVSATNKRYVTQSAMLLYTMYTNRKKRVAQKQALIKQRAALEQIAQQKQEAEMRRAALDFLVSAGDTNEAFAADTVACDLVHHARTQEAKAASKEKAALRARNQFETYNKQVATQAAVANFLKTSLRLKAQTECEIALRQEAQQLDAKKNAAIERQRRLQSEADTLVNRQEELKLAGSRHAKREALDPKLCSVRLFAEAHRKRQITLELRLVNAVGKPVVDSTIVESVCIYWNGKRWNHEPHLQHKLELVPRHSSPPQGLGSHVISTCGVWNTTLDWPSGVTDGMEVEFIVKTASVALLGSPVRCVVLPALVTDWDVDDTAAWLEGMGQRQPAEVARQRQINGMRFINFVISNRLSTVGFSDTQTRIEVRAKALRLAGMPDLPPNRAYKGADVSSRPCLYCSNGDANKGQDRVDGRVECWTTGRFSKWFPLP